MYQISMHVGYTACKDKMSSDKIFDLTAGVYFYFYIISERGWQLAAMSWARQQCQLSVHPES